MTDMSSEDQAAAMLATGMPDSTEAFTTPTPTPAAKADQPDQTPTEPHKMTAADELRHAGYSDADIAQYVDSLRPQLKAYGYTDEQINKDYGLTSGVPPSMVKRIVDTATEQTKAVTKNALGIAHEYAHDGIAQEMQRDIVNLSEGGQTRLWSGLKEISQGRSWSGTSDALMGLAQWTMSPLSGIAQGAGNAIGRSVTSLTGVPDLGTKVSDTVEFLLSGGAVEGAVAKAALARTAVELDTAAALANGAKVTRPMPGQAADAVVGTGLPTAQDFTNAAKSIVQNKFTAGAPTLEPAAQAAADKTAMPIVRDKLVRLHQEHGIHPAEVAVDSFHDGSVSVDMLAPQKERLPPKYLPDNYTQQPDLFGPQPEQKTFGFDLPEQTPPTLESKLPPGKLRATHATDFETYQYSDYERVGPGGDLVLVPHDYLLTPSDTTLPERGGIRGSSGRFIDQYRPATTGMTQHEMDLAADQAMLDFGGDHMTQGPEDVRPGPTKTQPSAGPDAQATGQVGPPKYVDEALPPRKLYTYDDRPWYKKRFDAAVNFWGKTFQPEAGKGGKGLQADARAAEMAAATSGEKSRILGQDQSNYKYFARRSDAENIDFLDRMERGEPQATPEDQAHADRHSAIYKEMYQREAEHGSKAEYVLNYLAHLFEKPSEGMTAQQFFQNKMDTVGPTWFQKHRDFDYIKEALDAGLRLKSTNPEALLNVRQIASVDMVQRVKLLRDWQDMGLARQVKAEVPEGAPSADTLARRNWEPIIGPDRQQWLISPEAKPVWDNSAAAKSLWVDQTMAGGFFRGYMAYKEIWVPFQLAGGAFHPVHVLDINFADSLTQAWQQLSKNHDIVEAAKTFASAVKNYSTAGFASNVKQGRANIQAWMTDPAKRTPEQALMAQYSEEGGFIPTMSDEHRTVAQRNLEKALKDSQWFSVASIQMRNAIHTLQAPVFEYWIPALKASSYQRWVAMTLERHPEYLTDKAARVQALRQIAKSVDDRFGEMAYSTLFWNRYVKEAGQAMSLSLGWNLGFVRQALGGLVEAGAHVVDRVRGAEVSPEAAIRRDTSSKLAFSTIYLSSQMLRNGLITFAVTGTVPVGTDWLMARIGTNPDGSPRRLSNPSNLRDVPQFIHHLQEHGGDPFAATTEMLGNKSTLSPFIDLATNRDYYGNQVADENAPWYQRVIQRAMFMGQQALPLVGQSMAQAHRTGGGVGEMAAAFFGYGPAPSYADKTGLDNRIDYLYRNFAAPYLHTQESGPQSQQRAQIRTDILLAQKANDVEAMRSLTDKWFRSGGSTVGLSNILLHVPQSFTKFHALPLDVQESVVKTMTPEQVQQYKPYMKSNVVHQVAQMRAEYEAAMKSGQYGTASAINQEIGQTIRQARKDGFITSARTFQSALKREMMIRHSPMLGALRAQPRKLRKTLQQGQTK